MAGGPALKDGFLLEGPGFGHDLPVGMLADDQLGVAKVGLMVCAKVQPGALPCPFRRVGQEFGLQDAVFMMPALWPRIGKQNKDGGEGRVSRERIKKVEGIGANEVKIGQLGAVALANPSFDSIQTDIHSDAEVRGMSRGIGREKVTVSTANLPDKGGFGWYKLPH